MTVGVYGEGLGCGCGFRVPTYRQYAHATKSNGKVTASTKNHLPVLGSGGGGQGVNGACVRGQGVGPRG